MAMGNSLAILEFIGAQSCRDVGGFQQSSGSAPCSDVKLFGTEGSRCHLHALWGQIDVLVLV